MRNKIILIIFIVFIISIAFFSSDLINSFNSFKKNIYISSVLSQESYSYLPDEAKDYIREVYNKTGEVLLTEKNKEEDKLYLNPRYVEYLSYTEEEKENTGDIPISMIVDYKKRVTTQSINFPSSYDLRNASGKNYLTPVRDQGNLGICWTFATAGALESHLLKTNNVSYTSSSQLISERQIDYATSKDGIKDYKSEYVSFVVRKLGDGGNFYISTIALANGISVTDYNSFKPYNDKDLSKMELKDVLSYDKSLYEVNSTVHLPSMNLRDSTSLLTKEEKETRDSYIKEVKQNIMDNGAAYVGTYMNSSCIYEDSNLNNIVIDVYNCKTTGGHAMEIIGWNDNIEYSYCADTSTHKSVTSSCKRVVSGKGVWILKNSWGDSYQYPYLTYDSLYTFIGFIDEVQSSNERTWDNNYILGEDDEGIKTKTFTLDSTKIKNDELIKKVKFFTEKADTEYSVKIKKKDGTYATFSKTNGLPGLITINITEDILVNKDTEITIYSDNEFIDKISIFTANYDLTAKLDLSKYNNTTLVDNSIRLYSETKNIPSAANVTYKLYSYNGQEINNKATFTNNEVAENNINTFVEFTSDLTSGIYRIDALYNSGVLGTFNFSISEMQGSGTEIDPYKVTNSTQLYQIRQNLDAYYELENDIDLTEDTHEGGKYSLESSTCPQGFGWEAIDGFSGTLDGKGHTIKGLYQNNFITCNEEKEVWAEWHFGNGLFSNVKKNAVIKNLVLEDFDITCQGGFCGALVSNYIANMNDSGGINYSDNTEYNATFENIAIINSKVKGVYNSNAASDYRKSKGGGLFGNISSFNGNINISNIYLDIDIIEDDFDKIGYLAHTIEGSKAIKINNIRLNGELNKKLQNGILINNFSGGTGQEINNIISTLTSTNTSNSFLGTYGSSSLPISGINKIDINTPICLNDTCQNTASDVNIYDKDTQIEEFTKPSNYSSWTDFNNNWELKTIDGIPRIPVLKFMNFNYTNIPNITLNQELNKKISLLDYITPNITAAKRVSYRSNDESIVKLEDNGFIVPQSTGSTTIHVESLYDGYIKDVPISVTYVPHYEIKFDANGGTGAMDTIEVPIGNNYVLPENKFVRDYYEFIEWNTKSDGTGTTYSNLSEITKMADKESITLYAQWLGEKRLVTFDANGGTVTPDKKMVRLYGNYGELPVPTRSGYGFITWKADSVIVSSTTRYVGSKLVASWKEDAYTIIYDANGGALKENASTDSLNIMSDMIATTYVSNNVAVELGDEIYEREGFLFKNWNTKADGTGTSYSTLEEITLSSVQDSVLRLYAIWEGKEGTISFNSNYENDETKTQTFIFGTETKLDKNTFTRIYYDFKEWNTKADGTGTSYIDEQSINRTSDLTLYAIWQESVDFTVDSYDIDQTNKYISKIMVNTEVNTFTSHIMLGYGYGIDVDTKTINNKQLLYTGGKTRITKGLDLHKEYTNVVIGDINGDAAINSADLLKIRQHLLGSNILTNFYFLSSDINYDCTINSADLLRLRQHLLGSKPIE